MFQKEGIFKHVCLLAAHAYDFIMSGIFYILFTVGKMDWITKAFNAEVLTILKDHSQEEESYRYIAIKKRHVPVVLKLAIV